MPYDSAKHTKPRPARYQVEFLPGHGYYVIDPDGKRASIYTLSRVMAEQWCDTKQRAADAARKRIDRPCLCCGAIFASEGIHNRMCNACRTRPSNDEAAPFSFGAIHGRKRA
jgi:hypothetical protein